MRKQIKNISLSADTIRSSLENQLQEANQKVSDSDGKIERLNSQLSILQTDIQTSRSRCDDPSTKLSALGDEVRSLKDSLTESEKALDVAQGTVSKLDVYRLVVSGLLGMDDCSSLKAHFESIARAVPTVVLKLYPSQLETIESLEADAIDGTVLDLVCRLLRYDGDEWALFDELVTLSSKLNTANPNQERLVITGLDVVSQHLANDAMDFSRSLLTLRLPV